ncbi:MAG: exosortase family protein XrtF [Cyclobacteriaceae bacterium]|nr:exosortase family protein XrtF [Cyclobacteriaceae bacterium]
MGESPRELVKQFKPALRFLGVFLAVYLVGNTLYGVWIQHLNPAADPITVFVTTQTADLLSLVAHPVEAVRSSTKPTVHLQFQQETRLVVYEGCNGVNVMIVFLAFTLGFGGRFKSMVWFIPLGLALIHVANLFRIMALYAVAIQFPKYFYYTHKYLFTASLYVGVLLLWWWWVRLNRVGHG